MSSVRVRSPPPAEPPCLLPLLITVPTHHTHRLSSREALYSKVACLEKECQVSANCQPASECPSGVRTQSARCTSTAELLRISLAGCTRFSGAAGHTEGYCFPSASGHGFQASPCIDILPDKPLPVIPLSHCGLPSHKRPNCPRSEDSFSSRGAGRGQMWAFET